MDIRQEVRNFVVELLKNKGDTAELCDSDSLLLSGRLQSLDAVNIALFLEQEYVIDFSEIGFDVTQLDSIAQIACLVERSGKPSS